MVWPSPSPVASHSASVAASTAVGERVTTALALLDHASSWVTLRDSLHVEADDAVSIIQWMMQLVLAQAERDQSSSDHPPA